MSLYILLDVIHLNHSQSLKAKNIGTNSLKLLESKKINKLNLKIKQRKNWILLKSSMKIKDSSIYPNQINFQRRRK